MSEAPPILARPAFRWSVLAAVVVLAVALSTIFLVRAAGDQREAKAPTAATKVDQALPLAQVLAEPHVVFRSTAPGPTYGMLAAVPLADPAGDRAASTRPCDRVYATADGGLCLSADRGVLTTYKAEVLDASMADLRPIPTNGIPSRARMSSDGSWAATTSFVSGHGYTDLNFSTETTIVSPETGRGLGNLEQEFATYIDGKRVTAKDLNVWGVTFPTTDKPTSFYATVATGGKTWLARGNMSNRTLTAIQGNAECPSLSPDGTRIIYKKRVGTRITWRYNVLDLRTGIETPLAETRSVDDQAEWLDDDRVLYGLPRAGTAATDVWVDDLRPGAGPPRLFIPYAWSPAVVASS